MPHRARHIRRILEHVCNRPDTLVWNGEQIRGVRPKTGRPPVRKAAKKAAAKRKPAAKK